MGERPLPLSRRLRIAAAIASVIWLIYLAIAIAGQGLSERLIIVIVLVLSASVGVWIITAHVTEQRTLHHLGTAYLLFTAFAIAIWEAVAGFPGVSWNAAWILFFPVLVPGSPRRTLIKALLAATMGPLAYVGLILARGGTMPGMEVWLSTFLPVYVAAAMAYAAARFLNRLRDEASEVGRLGLYELIEVIGTGGMGEVWRARHQLLFRPAAIKLIHRTKLSGGGGEHIRRFEREAQVTASLQSPHTVQLYDFGVTGDGGYYYVMELLEGMDLQTLVERYGPLPEARAVHIVRQVLDSLAEAHERDLVHRDIKPANIHIGPRGLRHDHVKVLDFGLVKLRAVPRGALVTDESRIRGTPAYLAPELALGTTDIDGRTDIYSLGCVLYFLLTGMRVFPWSDGPMSEVISHVTELPVPPSLRGCPDLDTGLEAALMQCLAKEPRDRPNAKELDTMLQRLSIPRWTESAAKDWWEKRASLPTVPRVWVEAGELLDTRDDPDTVRIPVPFMGKPT